MNNNFLTIGEFSHQTGISIKSLRYYDKIGVLKPNYIDSNTNYRYYTKKQVIESYFVEIALECEIPLKYFKENFIDENGIIKSDLLISYSKKILEEKKNKIERSLKHINIYDDEIKRLNSFNINEIKEFEFPLETFIIKPFDGIIDSYQYNDKLGDFFSGLTNVDLTFDMGIYFGILKINNKSYIFSEYEKKNKVKLNNGYSYFTFEKGIYKTIKTNNPNIINENNYQISLIREETLFNISNPIYEFIFKQ